MSPPNILLVEDERLVSMDIQHRLLRLGYDRLRAVASGAEAIDLADADRPNLVLMDICLEGGLDGIETAELLRQRHQVPVVYITADVDRETFERAKITEPFGYLIKPFEDRELQSCIEMALYKHQMERRILENERWLATTLRSITDAVLTTDARGCLRFANPVAEQLLNASAEELISRPIDEVLAFSRDEDLCPVRPSELPGSASLQNGTALILHIRGLPPRPVEVTASALQDDDGDTSGMVMVLRDMTESRRNQERLRQSLRDLRRTLDETVAALAITSEKRDPYTAGHQQRVAQLAHAISLRLGLPEEQREAVRVAALLHDIGKIYIPAEILAKPTRLTNMEMGMMKTHSEVGRDILKNVSFPWPVAQIVLQHHERVDGSGYPHGLAGEDILLEARVVAVADVVEAMSSHRPYRPALGLSMALAEIEDNAGQLYENDIVAACLKLFNQDGFQFE